MGLQYTYNMLKRIYSMYPDSKFVMLIGCDNLINFDKWHRWQDIVKSIPIVVFNRLNQMQKAMRSKAAIYMSKNLCNNRIIVKKDVGFCFLQWKQSDLSSTKIRGLCHGW